VRCPAKTLRTSAAPNNSMESTRPAECLALSAILALAGRAAHLEAVGRHPIRYPTQGFDMV